ncbi:hypothetical protein M9Y10_025279 [Tritrichomonas musculus]|uniref:Uncharacterized protein n=1 Tax=Tritrichomonas musculus TaxID=1915356 RepID=A0ABR2HA27_9EUKA
MIFYFLLYKCISNIDASYFADTSGPTNSEDLKSSITEIEKNSQCFEDLNPKIKEMCINLDPHKRKALAVSILICEYTNDKRDFFLPPYINDDDFVQKLNDTTFNDFTTWYTGIDSICFHYAHEQLSASNLQKILNVYKAVTLSTEFLIAARDNLEQTTKTLRVKLVDVQEQIFYQATSISNMTELIKNTTEKIMEITNQVSIYKNSISNAKYYLVAVGLSIVASFIFPNVFMPVLFITGIYLFFEVNIKPKYAYYLTGKVFKYSYVAICAIIFLLSVWDRIGLIKVKFFDIFKKKRYRAIPRICE